ncbi:mCG114186, partial [Mus musculus]
FSFAVLFCFDLICSEKCRGTEGRATKRQLHFLKHPISTLSSLIPRKGGFLLCSTSLSDLPNALDLCLEMKPRTYSVCEGVVPLI